MNRYILDAEDSIRVLPPQDGENAAIEVFCGRTMIFFDVSQLESACLAHGVEGGDALRFVGADTLLGAKHEVYVPLTRPDASVLREGLRQYAPQEIWKDELQYVKEACDHKGPRHA